MDTKEIIDLVEKATKKDNVAMEKLYKEFYKDVLFVCKKYNLSDADAEDVAQETFIKAFKEIGRLEKAGSFKPWISRIASNNCLNLLKHQKTLTMDTVSSDEEMLDIPDKNRSFEDVVIDNEVKEILAKMMEELPVEQRVTLFMYYYQDFSVKEIAQAYGCSENTVLSRLNYARKAMRKKADALENEGVKLRTIAALPFLFLFFAEERKVFACEIPDCVPVISKVMGARATAGTVATSGATVAATVSKTTIGLSVGKIIAIVAGIIAVIGIGVGVTIGISKSNENDDKNGQSLSVNETEEGSKDNNQSQSADADNEENTEESTVVQREKYNVYISKATLYYSEDEIGKITYYEYDDNYNLIHQYTVNTDDEYLSEYTYEYNENGDLLSRVIKFNDKHYETIINEYYEDGTLSKCTMYTGSECELDEITEYDENGNEISFNMVRYGLFIEYTYDENNRVLTRKTYDEDELSLDIKYTYLDDENIVEIYTVDTEYDYPKYEKIGYYKDGREKIKESWNIDDNGEYIDHRWTEYEYNDNNELILEREYTREDTYGDTTYKYDENGRVIEKIQYYTWDYEPDEKQRVMNKYTYKFDENDNEIYYTWWTGDEGENLRTETTREYDEYNNLISWVTKRDGAHVHYEYFYNEKNGLEKEVSYDENGFVEEYTVYENIYIKSND